MLFFIISTLSILILNFAPLIILTDQAPAGRSYSMIHNNIQDFYFYQALMNQGASGNLLIHDPYTTETHKSSVIFSFFTWIGKISSLLHIPYVYSYHFMRVISSLLFFIAAFKLIKLLKLPYPQLTYLFFLFASPFFNGSAPYMNWWTGIDAVRRAAYLPHHMFGGFLLIMSIIFILKFFSTSNLNYLIAAALLSPFIAFVHTPSLMILLISLPPSVLIYMLTTYKNFKINKVYISLFFYFIIGLLSLAFMVSQTNRGFPWNQYLLWERTLQYPLNRELIPALGILSPFAAIGLIVSLISKKFEGILIASWFLVPFLLIPFAENIGISNIRLIQGIPYLTLSILAIIGIDFVLKLTKEIKFLPLFLLSVICCLFIIFSYPVIAWSVKDQVREFSTIYSNAYLDKRLNAAFDFINKNYKPKTTTVSSFYTGNYLPVFTHTISYIGHSGYTNNLSKKEKEVTEFFSMKMTENEAKTFLSNNNITLIFQGFEEKQLFQKHLYPEILSPVYDRQEATIYEIK